MNQEKNTKNQLKSSFFYNWTKFFVVRWRVTIILLIAIILAGTVGIFTNQRQAFPPIPINFVVVSGVYPGASAETVEKQVIIPAQTALNEIDDIKQIQATASDNFASLIIEMNVFETDEINNRASQIADSLESSNIPSEVEFNVSVPSATGPTMFLAIIGDDSCEELIACASDISRRIERSSNEISKVELIPSDKFEVRIEIDAQRMASRGLNYQQVSDTLRAFSTALPGGEVQFDNITKSINIESSVSSLQDIKKIQLNSETQLEDIAEVSRVAGDLEDSIAIAGYLDSDGNPVVENTIYLAVFNTPDGDAINISNSVQEELENLKNSNIISQDFETQILFDAGDIVTGQIDDLVSSALLGLVLILVVLLFFINFRAAVVVSFILPLAFLSTLAIFLFIGFSINILTLFAMILALGILVDNAIVITEGMVFELEEGKTTKEAALNTVAKLGPAVTSATLTTLVVFVPFALIPGIIGEFLKFIPYTVIIMMVTSYILAISITPFFGRYLLSAEKTNLHQMPKWQKFLVIPYLAKIGQGLIDRIADIYRILMTMLVDSKIAKWIVLGASLVILVLGYGVTSSLEFNTFPEVDSPQLVVNTSFPVGTENQTKREILTEASKIIAEQDDFISLFVQNENINAIFEDPADREQTIFEIVDTLNQEFTKIIDENEGLSLNAQIVSNGPPSDEFDIVYQFKTENIEQISELLLKLEDFVADLEYVERFENRYQENLVETVNISFNEEKLAQFGLNPLAVGGIIRNNFATNNIGTAVVSETGVADNMVLSIQSQSVDSLDKLRRFQILPNVELRELAKVEIVESPRSINRTDGERVLEFAVVAKDKDNMNQNEVVDRINQAVFGYLGFEKIETEGIASWFAPDYDRFDPDILTDKALVKDFGIESASQINLAGADAQQSEDFGNLGLVLILAVLAVYIILVNQFNSYTKPILILFTVVFAFAGVFPGLWMFGEALSFISGLGVLALIGIAVNDAIVFVDALLKNQTKEHLETDTQVLVETGFQRFKPILSTTITTILGILPLTISDPFWRGLGIAIITGLLFSTFATLVLIPLIYDMIAKLWNKFFPKYKSKNLEER